MPLPKMSIDASVGADAEGDTDSAFLNLFGKLTASVDSLSATIDKQMRREQWKLANVPVSIPLVQQTTGAATQIIDFGSPQSGREWVIRLLSAITPSLSTNAAIVTWYIGQNIPSAAGILQAGMAIWQFNGAPNFQNFTSDVFHVKPSEHLLVGITGGTAPIVLRANINDEILYNYDTLG